MEAERWRRIEDIFHRALALDETQRGQFLDRECGDNQELRREVESLLALDSRAKDFIESPAVAYIPRLIVDHPADRGPAEAESTEGNAEGTIVGPYRLIRMIGEGGMGEVWLAEQKQPIRRRVAIKLIKAGMDTREVVARFESERQALALMDHPAIAKVFDAGSTSDGRPYFVMEYVPGIPISDYCDRHKLTVRQRMELFIQVCEGVQHAHQKAIIHRDLKPSNILVAEVDGKPIPRIIDFGVAKAISQKLTAASVYTRVGMLVGTIGYMSPEQANATREDLDTRTDVYSLGVVLYELFTGALPLDFKKLAYDEVLRCLRDQDVPRPSTRVTTLGEDSTIAARNRGSDPLTLVRQLRGDPDVIALKALEKDRACRYASASELAADIGRYLRHEPVAAHPPRIAYRARKYLRRHRLGLAVAVSAVMAVALLVIWWRIPPAVPVVESIRQLTDDGEPKRELLADGSRIYFTEGPPGSPKIFQVPVTGGPVTPVETGLADADLTGVARDGSGLLIVANDGLGGNEHLWWIPLPSGAPRRLGNLNAIAADILPDGRIVFAKFNRDANSKETDIRRELFIADKDGSNPRELASLPGPLAELFSSPDGRRILVGERLTGETAGSQPAPLGSTENDHRLFEIGVDGTGLRQISKISGGENVFGWTPDQQYLVYQSGNAPSFDIANAQQSDIWLLPVQIGPFRRPGKPIQLTNGPIPYSYAYPSQDGKQIFVVGTKQRGELIRYDMQSHEFTPFLSGISATSLTFSRDGKWVAYVSYPDYTVWRSRSDGTERKQLTFPPMQVWGASISPNGTRVAFCTDKREPYVVSVEGGPQQKIDGTGLDPSWSPDGDYLYFPPVPVWVGGVIISVRTGEKSPVTASEYKSGDWLNQDTLIARKFENGKFQTFDLKTQKWTDFAPSSLGKDVLASRLSPDGKYLYYITGGAEPKVLRLRIADQRVETVTSLKNPQRRLLGFSVALDGSPIFTRDTGYQEIYALNIRWP